MAKIKKFVPGVTGKECVIPKGKSFGDRRFRYKNFWCLSSREKEQVRGQYPHKTPGIPDSAFAYPINKNGEIAHASRTLVWSLAHVKRKVGAARAKGLAGRRH